MAACQDDQLRAADQLRGVRVVPMIQGREGPHPEARFFKELLGHFRVIVGLLPAVGVRADEQSGAGPGQTGPEQIHKAVVGIQRRGIRIIGTAGQETDHDFASIRFFDRIIPDNH